MKRRLFTILSALSLLLFVAVCVLWVRSYRWEYWLEAQSTKQTLERVAYEYDSFGCSRGRLVFHRYGAPAAEHRHWALRSFQAAARADWFDSHYRGDLLGFTFDGHLTREHWRREQTIIVVPLWAIATMTLAFPMWHSRKVWASRPSRSHGHCQHCGYDLCATPGRCPECGTSAPVTVKEWGT